MLCKPHSLIFTRPWEENSFLPEDTSGMLLKASNTEDICPFLPHPTQLLSYPAPVLLTEMSYNTIQVLKG